MLQLPDNPAKRRQTRSQTHIPNSSSSTQAAALAILQQPTPPLVVDKPRLEQLLTKTVESTGDCTIEQCEKLFSLMSQCVFHHRREYNKTQLIQVGARWSSVRVTAGDYSGIVTRSL